MQSLKQSYCQGKSLKMDLSLMAFEGNCKGISRKVRKIETLKYPEKETGGHSGKKECSAHVGNVGRRKGRRTGVFGFSSWTDVKSQETVSASKCQKSFREYYPPQKKQWWKKLDFSGLRRNMRSMVTTMRVDFWVICLNCSIEYFNMSTAG